VILFCHSSMLLKLFVDEDGSDCIANTRANSEAIPVCRITWAESMAALAQCSRVKVANQPGLTQAKFLFVNIFAKFTSTPAPRARWATVIPAAMSSRFNCPVSARCGLNVYHQCKRSGVSAINFCQMKLA
jgi:hypothetical protein